MDPFGGYMIGITVVLLAAFAVAAARHGCRHRKEREQQQQQQQQQQRRREANGIISIATIDGGASCASTESGVSDGAGGPGGPGGPGNPGGVTWVYRTPLGENIPYRVPYVIDVSEYFPDVDDGLPTYEDIYGQGRDKDVAGGS